MKDPSSKYLRTAIIVGAAVLFPLTLALCLLAFLAWCLCVAPAWIAHGIRSSRRRIETLAKAIDEIDEDPLAVRPRDRLHDLSKARVAQLKAHGFMVTELDVVERDGKLSVKSGYSYDDVFWTGGKKLNALIANQMLESEAKQCRLTIIAELPDETKEAA